jgi:RNA polymerase sigma factor (sigma-70 family)
VLSVWLYVHTASSFDSDASRAELDDFGALYEATFADVYRLVLGIVRDRALASDLTQESFLAAFSARGRFRGDVPAKHWLMRIAANRAISATRRTRRIRWLPMDARHDSPRPGPEAAAITRLVLDEALDVLTAQQRAAVTLRYLHDLEYAAIGRILGITTNNVGVTLTRALARMRQHIDEGAAANE